MHASSAGDPTPQQTDNDAESADSVLLRLMNNDKNITTRSTMLSLKFVDNLDRIGGALLPPNLLFPSSLHHQLTLSPFPLPDVCIVERRLEDAVAAHADGMQVALQRRHGTAFSRRFRCVL